MKEVTVVERALMTQKMIHDSRQEDVETFKKDQRMKKLRAEQ